MKKFTGLTFTAIAGFKVLRLSARRIGLSDYFKKGFSAKSMDSDGKGGNQGHKGTAGNEEIVEGKAIILTNLKDKTFYNKVQEFNRDVSIVALQSFINREKQENVTIFEAMGASGVRSIRYAKELDGVNAIYCNDISYEAVKRAKSNVSFNKVGDIVKVSADDCSKIMYLNKNSYFAVDLDPFGTPTQHLDAAVQGVRNGGLLLVTATDMAILAGNVSESCFAKYGSMSLKSKACHELALRILLHSIQTNANKYGRIAIPLISIKAEFYIRVICKIVRSPSKAKRTVLDTSMVFQCTGCSSLSLQPLASEKNSSHCSFAAAPVISPKCSICRNMSHIGGPIWSGRLFEKTFVEEMMVLLDSKYAHLKTHSKMKGLLTTIAEEVENPLLYEVSHLCSILKMPCIPLVQLRSAILNLGYKVSGSHVGPNTIKTNAPNRDIWAILKTWRNQSDAKPLPPKSPGSVIIDSLPIDHSIDFTVHPDANTEKQKGLVRYHVNPAPYWGPGTKKRKQIPSPTQSSSLGIEKKKKDDDNSNKTS